MVFFAGAAEAENEYARAASKMSPRDRTRFVIEPLSTFLIWGRRPFLTHSTSPACKGQITISCRKGNPTPTVWTLQGRKGLSEEKEKSHQRAIMAQVRHVIVRP